MTISTSIVYSKLETEDFESSPAPAKRNMQFKSVPLDDETQELVPHSFKEDHDLAIESTDAPLPSHVAPEQPQHSLALRLGVLIALTLQTAIFTLVRRYSQVRII
jgi:hypothetical protein